MEHAEEIYFHLVAQPLLADLLERTERPVARPRVVTLPMTIAFSSWRRGAGDRMSSSSPDARALGGDATHGFALEARSLSKVLFRDLVVAIDREERST